MPIDPNKFKKIVNNHFKNISEKDFLKNIRKSSPYLFSRTLQIFIFIDKNIKSTKLPIKTNFLSGLIMLLFPWENFYTEKEYIRKEFLLNRNQQIGHDIAIIYELTDLKLARDLLKSDMSKTKASSSVLFMTFGILIIPTVYIIFLHTKEFNSNISIAWTVLVIYELIAKKMIDLQISGQESKLYILEHALEVANTKSDK
jgi:hypothetical protein